MIPGCLIHPFARSLPPAAPQDSFSAPVGVGQAPTPKMHQRHSWSQVYWPGTLHVKAARIASAMNTDAALFVFGLFNIRENSVHNLVFVGIRIDANNPAARRVQP